jgi:hypothetical protein
LEKHSPSARRKIATGLYRFLRLSIYCTGVAFVATAASEIDNWFPPVLLRSLLRRHFERRECRRFAIPRSMLYGVAILLFVAALDATIGQAKANCGQPSAPRVAVDAVLPEVTHDFTKTPSQLLTMGPDSPHARRGTMLGLTVSRSFFELQPEIRVVPQPDGSYCVNLTAAKARIGYKKIDVYVTRHLNGETCLREHVLGHENHHVDIARQTLAEFAPTMEAALVAAASRVGVMQIRNSQEAAARLHAALKPALDKVFQDFNKTLERRQAEFDSPAEYARSNTVCDGRLNAIIQMLRSCQTAWCGEPAGKS